MEFGAEERRLLTRFSPFSDFWLNKFRIVYETYRPLEDNEYKVALQ